MEVKIQNNTSVIVLTEEELAQTPVQRNGRFTVILREGEEITVYGLAKQPVWKDRAPKDWEKLELQADGGYEGQSRTENSKEPIWQFIFDCERKFRDGTTKRCWIGKGTFLPYCEGRNAVIGETDFGKELLEEESGTMKSLRDFLMKKPFRVKRIEKGTFKKFGSDATVQRPVAILER